MSPRIYQLSREAVAYMAVQESPLKKRVAKAYFLFLIHIDGQDVPEQHRHHLDKLQKAFEDEASEKVGTTDLATEEAEALSRNVVDLFNGIADEFRG
ncbi:MAG: hypothetical protein CME19_09890 [Gemmatimonadetes bacterium]|nr:hypothetical protein [Gemmatimonadota bacterium]|tara:strand:- start:695 stop:985 length:291 start_codon:yes stop_codon:yes gene_type:complete